MSQYTETGGVAPGEPVPLDLLKNIQTRRDDSWGVWHGPDVQSPSSYKNPVKGQHTALLAPYYIAPDPELPWPPDLGTEAKWGPGYSWEVPAPPESGWDRWESTYETNEWLRSKVDKYGNYLQPSGQYGQYQHLIAASPAVEDRMSPETWPNVFSYYSHAKPAEWKQFDRWGAGVARRKALVPDLSSWSNKLDIVTDPIEFLSVLKMWRVAGASASLVSDKARRYKEILTYRLISVTYDMMEISRTLQDLDALFDVYNFELNRRLQELHDAIVSPEAVRIDTYESGIADSVEDVFYERLPANVVTQLEAIQVQAQKWFIGKLYDLEAAIATYSTPELPFQSTPEMLDPSKNLCWVYDDAKSTQYGTPTYVNTCVNRNADFAREARTAALPTFAMATPEQQEGITTPWTTAAYDKGPQIRADNLRVIPTESGYQSVNDLRNAGLLPSEGPGLGTLLAVGGLGLAIWGLQALG